MWDRGQDVCLTFLCPPSTPGDLIFMGPHLTTEKQQLREKGFSPTFLVQLVVFPEHLVMFLQLPGGVRQQCPQGWPT